MLYRSRKLIHPADLNYHNTLFGGKLLLWIDEECAIYSACQLNNSRIVTKYMSEINFVNPARIGDVIEIGVETVAFGNTSHTVKCVVRNKADKSLIVTIDKIVFVAVDIHGIPTQHGVTEVTDG